MVCCGAMSWPAGCNYDGHIPLLCACCMCVCVAVPAHLLATHLAPHLPHTHAARGVRAKPSAHVLCITVVLWYRNAQCAGMWHPIPHPSFCFLQLKLGGLFYHLYTPKKDTKLYAYSSQTVWYPCKVCKQLEEQCAYSSRCLPKQKVFDQTVGKTICKSIPSKHFISSCKTCK